MTNGCPSNVSGTAAREGFFQRNHPCRLRPAPQGMKMGWRLLVGFCTCWAYPPPRPTVGTGLPRHDDMGADRLIFVPIDWTWPSAELCVEDDRAGLGRESGTPGWASRRSFAVVFGDYLLADDLCAVWVAFVPATELDVIHVTLVDPGHLGAAVRPHLCPGVSVP